MTLKWNGFDFSRCRNIQIELSYALHLKYHDVSIVSTQY